MEINVIVSGPKLKNLICFFEKLNVVQISLVPLIDLSLAIPDLFLYKF